MIRRLQALYQRYTAVHAGRLRGTALGPVWARLGQVERVVRRGNDVEITGWTRARRLEVRWHDGSTVVSPDVPRPDVVVRNGGPQNQGFTALLPGHARSVELVVHRRTGPPATVPITHPSEPARIGAHLRLARAFLRDLMRAAPSIVRYALRPGPSTKAALKRALGLELATRGAEIERAWLLESPSPQPNASHVTATIVVPVFNAHDLLTECLHRVEDNTDLDWHLVLVDDASTDPAIRPWLQAFAADRPDRVTLLCHDTNEGFVGAVNRGLAYALSRPCAGPVILLNSDAMVPRGWASRLCAPLGDPGVASVTPMSNAAEILSIPSIGPGVALRKGEADAVDHTASQLGAVPLPDVPTGVGFCMAMSRDWLGRLGELDHAFGRGYGEEVDWCQKTRAMGARHLCQPAVFVEHVGGQSFGSDEKRARILRAGAIISQRYPRYDAEVQRFIANDPLATPRLALSVALAGARAGRLPVYLAHSLGGGAEAALRAECAGHEAAVVLRVGGHRRWQIEVHVAGMVMAGRSDDLDLIRRLLHSVPALDIVYSCGVGDSDPVDLPKSLLSLQRHGHGDRISMRLHDYFPVSPSYTLMGRDGFAGVPPTHSKDPCHEIRRPDGTRVALQDWRAAWARLVYASDEVVCFSQASVQLFSKAYSGAPVVLRPHLRPVPVRPMAPSGGRRIGILGNLNIQKGALIIRQLAKAHPRQTFVVIGLVDTSIPFPGNVIVHGAYERDEISDLASLYGIRAWLMPAVWPETFSFATREALATGLPVAGFALGAQGEALDRAPNGIAVALEPKHSAGERLFACLDPASPLNVAAE